MTFHANHGCLDSEREKGNEFKVDFQASYRSISGSTDNLQDTVDYGAIFRIVSSHMYPSNGKPCNLMEKLAKDIFDDVLDWFPILENIEVSVSKKNPPVGGECEWSTITYRG